MNIPVTVIVITYNSARYVVETLDSVYAQTYPDIELIVSDDCSTDATAALCTAWIESHRERFSHTLFTTTPHNGGIAANYNHARRHAHGEYLKYIAGDDALLPHCITTFVQQLQPDVYLYFCGACRVDADGKRLGTLLQVLPSRRASSSHRKINRLQLRYMLRYHPMVCGPGIFVHRDTLDRVGGFDEAYPMSEDYPILMRFLTHGYPCHIVNEALVLWRSHADSVSAVGTYHFYDSVSRSILHYSFRYCWRMGLPFTPYHDWVDVYLATHPATAHRLLRKLLRGLDVVYWYRKAFGTPPWCIETQP